jgi:hypothetical protein
VIDSLALHRRPPRALLLVDDCGGDAISVRVAIRHYLHGAVIDLAVDDQQFPHGSEEDVSVKGKERVGNSRRAFATAAAAAPR